MPAFVRRRLPHPVMPRGRVAAGGLAAACRTTLGAEIGRSPRLNGEAAGGWRQLVARRPCAALTTAFEAACLAERLVAVSGECIPAPSAEACQVRPPGPCPLSAIKSRVTRAAEAAWGFVCLFDGILTTGHMIDALSLCQVTSCWYAPCGSMLTARKYPFAPAAKPSVNARLTAGTQLQLVGHCLCIATLTAHVHGGGYLMMVERRK